MVGAMDVKKRRMSFRRASAAGTKAISGSAATALHLAGFQNGVECREPVHLRVLGKLPPWLAGSLLRPGPGTFDVPVEEGKAKGSSFSFRHIFDAPAMLHKFAIGGGGGVTYSSAKLNRGTEAHIHRSGQLPEFDGTFGQPPASGLMGRAISGMTGKLWKSGPKANVEDAVAKAQSNLVTILQGKLVVTSGDLIAVEPSTLQPLQRFAYRDLSPSFKGELCCGTPVYDPRTGETLSFMLQFVNASTAVYRICCVPEVGEPHVLCEYGKDEDFVYMHSFAVTSHYVVMAHWPAVIKPMKLLVGQQLLDALAWEPEKGTRFFVFDRQRGGKGLVATYRAEAFFAFHHINAYETADGSVVVDVMAFDDMSIAKAFKLKHLRKGNRPLQRGRPTRFVLEGVTLSTAKPTQARPAAGRPLIGNGPLAFEMARLDSRRSGLPYRTCYSLAYPMAQLNAQRSEMPYPNRTCYSLAYTEGGAWFSAIVKLDMASGRVVAAWAPPDHFPGEPIFVPRPGGTREDDGAVLSVVLNGNRQHSFLLVLDALTFIEVARAPLPHALPFGFHGHFVDSPAAEQE